MCIKQIENRLKKLAFADPNLKKEDLNDSKIAKVSYDKGYHCFAIPIFLQ